VQYTSHVVFSVSIESCNVSPRIQLIITGCIGCIDLDQQSCGKTADWKGSAKIKRKENRTGSRKKDRERQKEHEVICR
jgi:hypothetical protein